MNKFKKLSLFLAFLVLGSQAFAQLNMPDPSPDALVKQRVGFTDVTITYARPGVKGRKVFGGIVSYNELWRTGASDATSISFTDAVTIAGNKIEAGKYSLFSIPGEDEWTLILNRDTTLHGSSGYDEKLDVFRFKAKPETALRFYESFTIEINDIVKNNAQVYLIWENTQVKFPILSHADDQVMAEIHERINVKKEEKPGLYYQSALYYYNNDKDPNQALKWAKQAVKMREDFAYLQLQAKLEAATKDYKAAIASAKKSSELAQKNKMTDYVKANDELIREWTTLQKTRK
jgi:tetratricopeptide (TPR) repeat protein